MSAQELHWQSYTSCWHYSEFQNLDNKLKAYAYFQLHNVSTQTTLASYTSCWHYSGFQKLNFLFNIFLFFENPIFVIPPMQ
jgi:hypothetical protein